MASLDNRILRGPRIPLHDDIVARLLPLDALFSASHDSIDLSMAPREGQEVPQLIRVLRQLLSQEQSAGPIL